MSQKPNHSSSSDDEEEEQTSGSEDEQSGSDSEASGSDSGEKPKPEPKKTLTAPPQTTTKPQPPDASSSEEESSSDNDSDSDPPPKKPAVAVNVKPISSKPVESKSVKNLNSKAVKNDGSKTKSTSTPEKAPAKSKRPAEAPVETKKDAKKSKRSKTNGEVKKPSVSSSQATKSAKKPKASDPAESEPDESDSGSDTDTESDSPPQKSVATENNVKPIPSKPVESKSAKKTGSKAIVASSPAKIKPLPAPVTTPGKNKNDVKKATENSAPDEDTDTKKQLFQRLWSEDDEIVVLEGMINYKNEKGVSPIADIVAFHEFIKQSLHVDVSNAQLADKIRRLRKKYVNNASKGKDGKDRIFTKSHEQKAYDLSKLIWGGDINSNGQSGGTESKKKNQSKKNGDLKGITACTSTGNGVDGNDNDNDTVMMDVDRKLDVSRFVRYCGKSGSPIVSEEIVMAGLELVDGSKRAELEEKWRKLKEQELELYVKRMELMREQALVVLEAVRSSGN